MQDVDNLSEALRYTPGVQGEPFGFDPRFTLLRIRGFDATTTGLFRDSLQLRNPGFAISYNLEPYGAERIEVLRGPASVLYGQSGPGGLINYVSKRPTVEPLYEFQGSYGSFDQFQGAFDIGGPVTGGGLLLYRITGFGRKGDTQVDFVENDRIYIAPAFTWLPNEDISLTFLSHYQYDHTGISQALPADGTLFSNPNGSIPPSRFLWEPKFDEYKRADLSIGYQFAYRVSEFLTLSQNARYDHLDLKDNKGVFGSQLRDDLQTLDRLAFDFEGELDSFAIDNRAQVTFETGPVGHTLLFGLDYIYVDARQIGAFGSAPPIDIFDPVYGEPIDPLSVVTDIDQAQQQLGLYLQDQLNLYDKWFLVLAARYDWAEDKTDDKLAETRSKQEDHEFTWRAGILYLLDLGLAPYFSYSESFLPTLGVDASGKAFEPETGRQFEVGLKYQPPVLNTLVTVATFDLKRQNVLTPDPSDPVSQVQTGEVRSRGIEIEGVASFDFGLDFIAAYTFLDMEITKSNVEGEEG